MDKQSLSLDVLAKSGDDAAAAPPSLSKKPRSIASYGRQALGFTANRWFKGVIFCLIALMASGLYYGWQQFSIILAKGGAYAWLCEGGVPESGRCPDQDAAIQSLYPIGQCSEAGFGILAGILFDHLGPRGCGLFGVLSLGLGWFLLAFSTASFQALIPGMMFLAGAVNLITYPTFILGDLFPEKRGLCLAILIGCQSSCSLVPVVLLAVWKASATLPYSSLFAYYFLYVCTPLFVLYMLALPAHRVLPANADLSSPPPSPKTDAVASGDIAIRGSVDSDLSASRHEDSLDTNFTRVPPTAALENVVGAHSNPKGASGDRKVESATSKAALELERVSRGQSNASTVPSQNGAEAADIEIVQASWKQFWIELFTPDIHIFCFCHVVQLLMVIYYTTTVFSVGGDHMSTFFGYIQPSQTLFAFIYGGIVDKVGCVIICTFINTVLLLEFILYAIGTSWMHYTAAVFQAVASGFVFSSKFIYIGEAYPAPNFGKLIAYVGGVMAGSFALLNIPIVASRMPDFWTIFFIVLCAFTYVPFFLLRWRTRRGMTYKQRMAAKMLELQENKANDLETSPRK